MILFFERFRLGVAVLLFDLVLLPLPRCLISLKLLLLSLRQASKEVAYATAWRLAGESERTPLLSFYKVAINE